MKKRATRGYTLIELLVAMSLGLIIMGAGIVTYKQAMDTTSYLTQRSAVQVNARSAINQLGQDLNFAGYGLPIGGVAVPPTATFFCATTGSPATYAYTCPPTATAFPVVGGNRTLFGINPSYQTGGTVNGNKTDVITIAYVDSSPDFWNDVCGTGTTVCGFDGYPVIQSNVTGGTVKLTWDTRTSPLPTDAKWGLKSGDLVLVSNTNGEAVGYVSSTAGGTINLLAGDVMVLNQPAGTNGAVANLLPTGVQTYPAGTLTATTVTRLNLITYYVGTDPLAQAAGSSVSPYRVYRVLNGDSGTNPPVPIAEQIYNMNFTYDMFNSVCGGSLATNQASPTLAQIGLIKTVNAYITAAGTLAASGQKIQQMPLSTTVSPRNLAFFDSYSSTSNGTCS